MTSKKKMGRPTKYTKELANEICEAIATSEKGLQTLCDENPHWPERGNIFRWMIRYDDFRHNYTVAKERQVEVSIDYLQEMANEPHRYIDEFGNVRIDVSLLRCKMDAIKWKAGKLKAKKYGDSKQEEVNNDLHEDAIKRKQELDEQNKKEY